MTIEYNHHDFVPFPGLTNGHLMTMAPTFYPRRFPLAMSTSTQRLFEVEPGSQVLTNCHWQPKPKSAGTLLILHGLEGTSNSHYILGATEKALSMGMNVVRMNMRNCGDSLHLTPTLYNSGMSADVLAVMRELKDKDFLKQIFLAGYSMGGNIVLKAAAELGKDSAEMLSGTVAISPAIDLAPCVDALEHGFNRLYQLRFLRGLKSKIRRKNKLFPSIYDTSILQKISSIRAFDDAYTAPLGGYGDSANYYRLASSLPKLGNITVPTLIIQAQDDPLVPFHSFTKPELHSRYIHLLTPVYGGHNGFLQKDLEDPPIFDRFWAENRLVKFCLSQLASTANII